MDIKVIQLGDRKMLYVGNKVIPIDRIIDIDLDAPNGSCDNSVRINTDDRNDDFIWAGENANALRAFLVGTP